MAGVSSTWLPGRTARRRGRWPGRGRLVADRIASAIRQGPCHVDLVDVGLTGAPQIGGGGLLEDTRSAAASGRSDWWIRWTTAVLQISSILGRNGASR